MTNETEIPLNTLKELTDRIVGMNDIAQSVNVPLAQRIGALNRAQELGQQHLELSAARFHAGTKKSKKAAKRVNKALATLKKATDDINKITKRLEKAQKVVTALDKLLSIAVRFV